VPPPTLMKITFLRKRHARLALIAVGCASMSLAVAAGQQPSEDAPVTAWPPEIGTKMPDGTVYAGLSIDTGKPSFVPAAGGRMPDGTIYAGISPDSNQAFYATPQDAPLVFSWSKAVHYCKSLSAFGRHDWRVPSPGELAVLYTNRADIGGFNETGQSKNGSGYYWSSLQVTDASAWGQRFNDGYHDDFSKDLSSSLRCVR
jgi:hypothetical protein